MRKRVLPATALASVLAVSPLWAADAGIQGGQKIQTQPAVKLEPKVQKALTEPAVKVAPKIKSAPTPETKVKVEPETGKALTKPAATPRPSPDLEVSRTNPPAPGANGPATISGDDAARARLPAVQAPAIAVESARNAADAARAAAIASQIQQIEQLRERQQTQSVPLIKNAPVQRTVTPNTLQPAVKIPRTDRETHQDEMKAHRRESLSEALDQATDSENANYDDARQSHRNALRLLQEDSERKGQTVQKLTN